MDLFNIKGLQSSYWRINKIVETHPSQNKQHYRQTYQPKEPFEYILQREMNKLNTDDSLNYLSTSEQEMKYKDAIEEYSKREGITNVWI